MAKSPRDKDAIREMLERDFPNRSAAGKELFEWLLEDGQEHRLDEFYAIINKYLADVDTDNLLEVADGEK